ncbi:MAG: hypothetical protein IT225_06355 [Flavobacteriales bacterium]|nr:hypothetical protein [Flavobacteriales bacterium]
MKSRVNIGNRAKLALIASLIGAVASPADATSNAQIDPRHIAATDTTWTRVTSAASTDDVATILGQIDHVGIYYLNDTGGATGLQPRVMVGFNAEPALSMCMRQMLRIPEANASVQFNDVPTFYFCSATATASDTSGTSDPRPGPVAALSDPRLVKFDERAGARTLELDATNCFIQRRGIDPACMR